MKQLEYKLGGEEKVCPFGCLMSYDLKGAQDIIQYWFQPMFDSPRTSLKDGLFEAVQEVLAPKFLLFFSSKQPLISKCPLSSRCQLLNKTNPLHSGGSQRRMAWLQGPHLNHTCKIIPSVYQLPHIYISLCLIPLPCAPFYCCLWNYLLLTSYVFNHLLDYILPPDL